MQPRDLLRWGGLCLGGSLGFASLWLLFLAARPASLSLSLGEEGQGMRRAEPVSFSLHLGEASIAFPEVMLAREVSLSHDPFRPDQPEQKMRLLVQLVKTSQRQRVSLPAKIGLEYREGGLYFAPSPGLFWMELTPSAFPSKVTVSVWVTQEGQQSAEVVDQFLADLQESPLRLPQDFSETSPFRSLAEARWWGHDLFQEKYGSSQIVQRLEIGSLERAYLVDLIRGEWLIWRDGKWVRNRAVEGKGEALYLARIQEEGDHSLVWEGWEGDAYVRLSLPRVSLSAFRPRSEDLFSSVRARSEKQISCMLEKQWFVLKVGDWVLKTDQRWKILRKKEEKEAYLQGNLTGELFVLEHIDIKGGQKSVRGVLFNTARSQMAPLDIACTPPKSSSPLTSRENLWIPKAKKRERATQ